MNVTPCDSIPTHFPTSVAPLRELTTEFEEPP